MTKTTSPGWPDPTDWAKRLALSLSEHSSTYENASDVHERQKHLARLLNQMVKLLTELPPVAEHDLALPIMHLVDALDQANEGFQPPLFLNRKVHATRTSSVYWLAAKAQAIVSFYTLSEAGHSDPAELVVQEMNRARLARRNGEKQTRKSVMRFVDDFQLSRVNDEVPPWVLYAHNKLTDFRAKADWPVSVHEAVSYTRRAFSSRRLRPFFPDPQFQA